MKREEFIQYGLTLGAGLPFLAMFLDSCKKEDPKVPQFEINFSGKVLIIGAGAAGLTAGYLLQRNNIDFEIIEASDVYGGRVKRISNFADFPIDLGAEWIHAEPSVLAQILQDPSLNASIETLIYNPKTVYGWNNNKLKKQNWASNYYSEYKFKSTTWYGFFEKFIVPDIQSKISLNHPVKEINYSGSSVEVKSSNNGTFSGNRVLITTPVKILQNNFIHFEPALPSFKTEALGKITMGAGIKVFIEFKEKFYPDIVLNGSILKSNEATEKIFYDAAFGKSSSNHVLGLFTVGKNAEPYTSLSSNQEIIDQILGELDQIFDGKASQNYVKHTIQNWSKESFIQGSYSTDFDGNRTDIMNSIIEPIDKKLYFAGEALSDENQATVHGACETAYSSIAALLKD